MLDYETKVSYNYFKLKFKTEVKIMSQSQIDLKFLGMRIKKFRKNRNLTLNSLAELTGISKSYLSKLENAQHEPSFSVLLKISRALSIQVSDLHGDETDTAPYVITRVADRKGYTYKNDIRDYTQWALASKVKYKRMEPQLLEVPFNDDIVYQFNDERFVFVLEGSIKIIDGQILNQGDCVYITPNTLHSATSVGDSLAKVLLITCL